MAITTKSTVLGPLGRRWVAYCDVCNVKLPGHYVERESAENCGRIHEGDRHLSRMMDRLA